MRHISSKSSKEFWCYCHSCQDLKKPLTMNTLLLMLTCSITTNSDDWQTHFCDSTHIIHICIKHCIWHLLLKIVLSAIQNAAQLFKGIGNLVRNVCDKSSSGKRLYLIVTQDWRSPSRWWKGSFTNIYTVSTKISWILHHTRILSRWKSAAARQTQRTQCDFIIKTLKIRPSFLPEKQNEQYCPKLEAVNEGRRENLTMKKDWMEKNVPIHAT